jgi:hypothetical protein
LHPPELPETAYSLTCKGIPGFISMLLIDALIMEMSSDMGVNKDENK